MGTCRVHEDTLEEILRIQAFFELRGIHLTHEQIIKECLDLVKRKHKIPDKNATITETDLVVKRNILRKRGIEYESWVLKK